MLKMVILDDEKMERTYMKKYIDWNGMGIEIVGEAANGLAGLELCSELKPDIVITDIKMPHMDGLEFSKKVKEVLPDLKIIFVSGYGDFDYARSAVDLNAFGYILKPFRIDNVIDVVKKVVLKCDDEYQKNKEREQLKRIIDENRVVLKEGLIRELLDGIDTEDSIWGRVEFLGLKLSRGKFCMLLVEIDEFEELTASLLQEDRQILSLTLLQNIRNIVSQYTSGEAVKISEKQFAVILNFANSFAEGEVQEKAYLIADELKTVISQKQNISITTGVSRVSSSICGLNYLFEQAKDALRYKMFNLKGQIISVDDVQFDGKKQDIDLKKLDTELVECLRLGNMEKIEVILDEVFAKVLKDRSASGSYVQNICVSAICSAMRFLNEVNCTFEDVLGDGNTIWSKLTKFETIADANQWLKNIFLAILETLNMKKKSKNRLIVDKIIEIVNNRYGEDLTTKEISKDIFLSPNYIGAIFKEEMGTGFLEYLTRVRMEKAAEMLKDLSMKVYEIAQRVGYNNTPYFSTLFRDHTGMTPSEFRERM